MNDRSFNVLLADDESAVCLILTRALARLGNTTEAVYNGKDAMKLFTTKPGHFDILITDHNMPLVSGLEVVNYFRKNDFDGKIIVISGSVTEDLTNAYRSQRVDAVVQKPINLDHLTTDIAALLAQWK